MNIDEIVQTKMMERNSGHWNVKDELLGILLYCNLPFLIIYLYFAVEILLLQYLCGCDWLRKITRFSASPSVTPEVVASSSSKIKKGNFSKIAFKFTKCS